MPLPGVPPASPFPHPAPPASPERGANGAQLECTEQHSPSALIPLPRHSHRPPRSAALQHLGIRTRARLLQSAPCPAAWLRVSASSGSEMTPTVPDAKHQRCRHILSVVSTSSRRGTAPGLGRAVANLCWPLPLVGHRWLFLSSCGPQARVPLGRGSRVLAVVQHDFCIKITHWK